MLLLKIKIMMISLVFSISILIIKTLIKHFLLFTIPKDLTKVKSKVVFGLTKRQLICFGGALLVGVPLFFLIRGRVPTSAAALIMVFAMLPGFLLALYEKHGQPLEVVVRQIVECCFIQPKERPYALQSG